MKLIYCESLLVKNSRGGDRTCETIWGKKALSIKLGNIPRGAALSTDVEVCNGSDSFCSFDAEVRDLVDAAPIVQ